MAHDKVDKVLIACKDRVSVTYPIADIVDIGTYLHGCKNTDIEVSLILDSGEVKMGTLVSYRCMYSRDTASIGILLEANGHEFGVLLIDGREPITW